MQLGSWWTSPNFKFTNGHLSHTTTVVGGITTTATVQDYDPMGRVADLWQCTPVNCGSGSGNWWAANYQYDPAGDLKQWTHPAGFTIYQTPIDTARHATQVTSP